ncbi:glycosyltransferase [Escherichia coli]|nr:glycosyltransferase [Escherichia coli]
MSDIKVSVCIISFNQQNYIRQCLDGVFSQKTNFEYEVIIRDDCSTDNTYLTIMEYIDTLDEEKKKNIKITVLDGTKNIGANNNFIETFKTSVGQWLAICEGDDYWCDQGKLQKQYDYAISHSDCSLVVHPALISENNVIRKTSWACMNKTINQLSDVIRAKGQFSPTGSYFFKREILNVLPLWFSTAPVGDYYMEIFATSLGSCHTIPDAMSVYRINSTGSWSDLLKKDRNGQRIINTYLSQLEYLDKLAEIFPSCVDDITIKSSHAQYAAAMGYLANGDYTNFRILMDKSDTNGWYDNMHSIFYYLRNSRALSMLMFRFKPAIKSAVMWGRRVFNN